MKFGPVPLARAAGAILAHSVPVAGGRLRKGLRLEPAHIEALSRAGHAEVVVARLEQGDVHEDAAALALARALVPDEAAAGLRLAGPFTGRANLLAAGPGVAVLDEARLHVVNLVDPMITLATVPPWRQMAAGGMVATVKIISYGVGAAPLARACQAARGAIRLAPPVLRDAALIVTAAGADGGSAEDKGERAVAARLVALGLALRETLRVPHEEAALARAIAAAPGDLVLILTGSATSDEDDVAPAALRRAGGRVTRFGMPVDPGNLLLLGEQAGRPVIGLPGCARSPAPNGADRVLARVACGIAVTGEDIARMGVGGLLKEIPSRPQPRARRPRD